MHPGRYVSFTKDGKRTALRQLYRQTFVDLFSRGQNRADTGTKRTARACFFHTPSCFGRRHNADPLFGQLTDGPKSQFPAAFLARFFLPESELQQLVSYCLFCLWLIQIEPTDIWVGQAEPLILAAHKAACVAHY